MLAKSICYEPLTIMCMYVCLYRVYARNPRVHVYQCQANPTRSLAIAVLCSGLLCSAVRCILVTHKLSFIFFRISAGMPYICMSVCMYVRNWASSVTVDDVINIVAKITLPTAFIFYDCQLVLLISFCSILLRATAASPECTGHVRTGHRSVGW